MWFLNNIKVDICLLTPFEDIVNMKQLQVSKLCNT